MLNSIFSRATFGTRCKTCLNLAISRIKLLRNKRDAQLKHMRKEIFQYLQTGQEAIARIRVEHIIREENIMAAYEILELFCEFVLARVPVLETQRDCPVELQEAIASIIFSSPRCSDLPELMQIRNLFTAKYGKEFVSAASELRPDSSVNRTIIEKLSVRAPTAVTKLKTLKGIAKEYNLDWDYTSTEAEFSKKHEDLLDGSIPITTQDPVTKDLSDSSLSKTSPVISAPQPQAPVPVVSNNSRTLGSEDPPMNTNSSEPVGDQKGRDAKAERPPVNQNSSDILERARAAIAAAERASAAARAAAELVNARTACQAGNGKRL
ncbi:IST1-like protein [Iris pallida]|uniref:IST1-like protein n=1 Tax=Iris pallida TaxID=29817 RepID=A0AAX6EBV7_IRIPA|nr:IST1-like protein [Iris pallida]